MVGMMGETKVDLSYTHCKYLSFLFTANRVYLDAHLFTNLRVNTFLILTFKTFWPVAIVLDEN